MTISGALSNALSGLRASGRGAEVVSSNIANALTPGYGRRILNLSPSSIGDFGGVRIDGISRAVDAGLASDRRLAEAAQVKSEAAADFLGRVEGFLGTPDNPASLAARLARFENALITATSRPDAPERLRAAVIDAQGVVTSLSQASDGIQDARSVADRTIAQEVDRLNTSLQQVVRLNAQITAQQVQGGDVSSLLDQRQQLVDQIAVLAPVREVPRDNGQIALYTTGGAVLLDGTAATVGFTPSNTVTPYMSIGAGTLSGLTINGNDLRTDSERGALRGGSIGSLFAIRDEYGVAAQTEVDAIARDLVERFQDPAVDPTLAVGDAGLFTDNGAAFDPLDEVGLSSRLTLNAAVDPDQGGDAWRMRDGINAVAPGPVSDSTLLRAMTDALTNTRVPSSGGFGGAAFAASALVSTITSGIGAQRAVADQELSFANGQLTELTERQLADGVDTDAEIARLLLIEKSYAANARMIEVADELLQTILRL